MRLHGEVHDDDVDELGNIVSNTLITFDVDGRLDVCDACQSRNNTSDELSETFASPCHMLACAQLRSIILWLANDPEFDVRLWSYSFGATYGLPCAPANGVLREMGVPEHDVRWCRPLQIRG